VEFGLDPEQFWRLTPRMMLLTAKAAQTRQINEHNGRAWLAHTIAGLSRQKRLQPLNKLLIKKRERKTQTVEQQRFMIRAIASTFGGNKPDGKSSRRTPRLSRDRLRGLGKRPKERQQGPR
jgi:hypothetical protein